MASPSPSSSRVASALASLLNRLPSQAYLWIAVILFASSNAIVRKLTDIGFQNLLHGHNPISPCNVLFVSNLCALLVLIPVYYRQLNLRQFKQFSRQDWFFLFIVAILSGSLAPALVFQALTLTKVANVILLGRIEPPLILMLSVWFLGDRLNRWEIIGTLVAILGVGLTIALQTPIEPAMSGLISLGKGDLLTLFGVSAGAIATVISKAKLGHIPLGPFTILRTLIATVVFFVLALGLYGSNHFAEAFSPLLWQWMLGYGVVIVAIGQLLWYRGVRESTSSEVSLVNSFSPIAGILAAALILKELPTTAQYLGGAVILVGIILTQLGIWRKSIHRTPITNPSTMQAAEAGIGFKGT